MQKRITALLLIAVMAFFAAPLAVAQEEQKFSDVPSDHPAKFAIDFCAQYGFIKGYPSGTFRPSSVISRGDFVTVWARTFNVRQHNFSDVTKAKNETDNAVIIMYGRGYINGISATEFSLGGPITREMVAKIVENTHLYDIDGADAYLDYDDGDEISDWARNAVSVCSSFGVFDGVIEDNDFEPQAPMTRAEVCVVIYNLIFEPETPPETYTVTIDPAIENGGITSDKDEAAEGETVTLTVSAASGYQLVDGSLMANETPISGTTFLMPAEDVIVTAEFEPETLPETYTITIDPAIENGGITSDKDEAAEGETVTLTVSAASGYQLVDGSLMANETPISGTTFLMPAEDVIVTAEFEPETLPETYTITIDPAIENGGITSDKDEAAEGETVTLTVSAASGYQLVDGSLMANETPISGTTFLMPAEDVTVTAEFEPE